MQERKAETITFTAEESGARADAYASAVTERTRSQTAAAIEGGKMTINGKLAKKSDKLKKGDVVSITFIPEPIPDMTPKNIPFDVVQDCENYAVINKPAGLTVHPAPGNYEDTLVNALLYTFSIEDEDNGFRPGIVHRLDKDTSGLLLIAKNADARGKLSELFSSRTVDKEYMAICCGSPRFVEKTVEAPIARDTRNRQRMAISDSGKYAKSLFTVVEKFEGAFLARVKIFTGRTHQIRVHASHIGHPLVGDKLYGGKQLHGFERQALHSTYLSFIDPYTQKNVSISSQMPDDMLQLIFNLQNQQKR